MGERGREGRGGRTARIHCLVLLRLLPPLLLRAPASGLPAPLACPRPPERQTAHARVVSPAAQGPPTHPPSLPRHSRRPLSPLKRSRRRQLQWRRATAPPSPPLQACSSSACPTPQRRTGRRRRRRSRAAAAGWCGCAACRGAQRRRTCWPSSRCVCVLGWGGAEDGCRGMADTCAARRCTQASKLRSASAPPRHTRPVLPHAPSPSPQGLRVKPGGVHLQPGGERRHAKLALVEFETAADAQRALVSCFRGVGQTANSRAVRARRHVQHSQHERGSGRRADTQPLALHLLQERDRQQFGEAFGDRFCLLQQLSRSEFQSELSRFREATAGGTGGTGASSHSGGTQANSLPGSLAGLHSSSVGGLPSSSGLGMGSCGMVGLSSGMGGATSLGNGMPLGALGPMGMLPHAAAAAAGFMHPALPHGMAGGMPGMVLPAGYMLSPGVPALSGGWTAPGCNHYMPAAGVAPGMLPMVAAAGMRPAAPAAAGAFAAAGWPGMPPMPAVQGGAAAARYMVQVCALWVGQGDAEPLCNVHAWRLHLTICVCDAVLCCVTKC